MILMSKWSAESWQAFLDAGGGFGGEDFQRRNEWWLRPTPELRSDKVSQWKDWIYRHGDYLGTGLNVAALVAIIKLKGKAITMAGRYLWLVPTTAFLSGLVTILATEKFVGKKEAQELSEWYASAVSDPIAWHVETDRVVQGAAHAIIDDFTEGVTTSPSVAKGMLSQLYTNYESELREIGSWL